MKADAPVEAAKPEAPKEEVKADEDTHRVRLRKNQLCHSHSPSPSHSPRSIILPATTIIPGIDDKLPQIRCLSLSSSKSSKQFPNEQDSINSSRVDDRDFDDE